TNYQLTLTVTPGDRLVARAGWLDGSCRKTHVERLVDHMLETLEAMAVDPLQPVGALPGITSADRKLLARWSEGDAPGEIGGSVAEWISIAARQYPERLAVACGDARLTYRELEERADRLTGCLRAAGIGPDVCVGVAIDRSPLLTVAVLAVLKAGGACVP